MTHDENEIRVRTYLSMSSPADLQPASPAPGLTLTPAGVDDAHVVADTFDDVGARLHWPPRNDWDDYLAHEAVRVWLLRVHGEIAGIVALEAQGTAGVEVVSFGLLAPYIGYGFGGDALTRGVREAWRLAHELGTVSTVWLHTSSRDHPHALRNYQARGFLAYRREERPTGRGFRCKHRSSSS